MAAAGEVQELRGHCLSYGQNISLWLIADLLRTCFDVRADDETSHVQLQVTSVVGTLLNNQTDDTRAAAIDVLGEVLGLPIGNSIVSNAGAQARRQVLIRSVRLLLGGLAARRPIILVLEDLHWLDAASTEVLSAVLAEAPDLRLLVLAAQRPDWAAPWAEWSFVERLNLQPLDDTDSGVLARSVLGGPELTPALSHYVAERAGGNPFYIEELLRALREAGGVRHHDGRADLVPEAAQLLPATLTEIVLARLDHLDAPARNAVQVASVIGRSFAIDLLAQVLGREADILQVILETLRRAEIAFPRLETRPEYVFKHVTMRDVAYNTVLLKRRQQLHAAVGHAIASLYATDEYAEIIAYHYAKTEVHAEAALWLERAGDRAADMYANQAAIAHYEEARKRFELSGAGKLALAPLIEKLGGVFQIIAWYDEALEEFEQAAAIYRESDDLEGEARVAAGIGQVHFLKGAREESIRGMQQVLHRLNGRENRLPSTGVATLSMALVEPLCDGHQFEEALAAASTASTLAETLGDARLRARAEARHCLALLSIGHLVQARQVGDQALLSAEAVGDLESIARVLSWIGDITLAQGLGLPAREYYERALKVDENRGDLAETAYLLARLSQALTITGEWEQARAYLERTVELVRSLSFSYFSPWALLALGEHYLLLGKTEEATRYLEEPFTIAERSGYLDQVSYLQIPLAAWDLLNGKPEETLARLRPFLDDHRFVSMADQRAMQLATEAYLETGNLTPAGELIGLGLESARRQGNGLARLQWVRLQGMMAARQDQWETAAHCMDEALALTRAVPYPYQEARVLFSLGLIHLQAGDMPQGQQCMEKAGAIFQRLGAQPDLTRTEQALANALALNR